MAKRTIIVEQGLLNLVALEEASEACTEVIDQLKEMADWLANLKPDERSKELVDVQLTLIQERAQKISCLGGRINLSALSQRLEMGASVR